MGRKYTYNDVKIEFDNRNYELVSKEYVNCSTKMQYICKKHRDKGIQEITFSKLYHNGQGCYYCGRERTIASRITPIDKDYDKNLCDSKNFTYVSSYKEDNVYYINFICNNHEIFGIQKMRRTNMQRNIKGCQYCSNKNLPEWYVMKKKDELNPYIELLVYCLIHISHNDLPEFSSTALLSIDDATASPHSTALQNKNSFGVIILKVNETVH